MRTPPRRRRRRRRRAAAAAVTTFALALAVLASVVACNVLFEHEAPVRPTDDTRNGGDATGMGTDVVVIADGNATAPIDDGSKGEASTPPPTCNAGQTLCATGCMTLASDTQNCGRCGRQCDSVPCTEGRCPASQVTTIGPYVGDLAENGAFVYWTTDTDGTLKRFAKTGGIGSPQTLATLGFSPSGIALRDGFAYVATQNGTISRVPQVGGSPLVLGNTFRAAGIAIDAEYIYVAQYKVLGEIGRVPIDGGLVQKLAVGQEPLHMSVDDTHVYFTAHYTNPNADGGVDQRGVWRVGKDGGGEDGGSGGTGATQLLRGPVPSGVPVDDAGVYSADSINGAIVRVDHDGKVVPLATQADVSAICTDLTHVYFTSTSGTVARTSKSGNGVIEVLAIGPPIDPYTSHVVVDATTVFWTASEKIWRTAK